MTRTRWGVLGLCLWAGCGGGGAEEPELERFETHAAYEASGSCLDGQHRELQPDEPTGLGFTAADALQLVVGEHEASLTWLSHDALGLPASGGEEALTIEVSALDGAARHFDAEHAVLGHGVVCRDWVEAPVRVHVSSEHGALDERFEAKLYAMDPYLAVIYGRPSAARSRSSVLGELAAQELDAAGLDLELRFVPFGVAGHIMMRSPDEGDAGLPTSFFGATLAAYGDACGDAVDALAVPLDARLNGATARDALERFNAERRPRMDWEAEGRPFSNASFELTLEEQSACMGFGPFPGEVRAEVRASLEIASEDGVLDGRFPGTLEYANTGAPRMLAFRSDEVWPRGEREPVTPAELGFPGVDLQPSPNFAASVTLTIDADDRVEGWAQLWVTPRLGCEEEGGEPGCMGDRITLERGRIRP